MIKSHISSCIVKAINDLWNLGYIDDNVQLQITRKEFDGDYTFVCFQLGSVLKQNPQTVAETLGQKLLASCPQIAAYNVVKGFLNILLSPVVWGNLVDEAWKDASFGRKAYKSGKPVLLEFSSPNTNKPLHLGHIRNILLGWSVSRILEAAGHHVLKVNLVNDRGIHICKSMLAWQIWGNGETPGNSGKKGDHLVGDYYVRFDQEYKREVRELVANGSIEEDALQKAPLMVKARTMLQRWEAMDEDVRSLWHSMNSWVYEGFDQTYARLGVHFDRVYHESDTYVLGKDIVNDGLARSVLQCREDGSVWIDLRDDGLDEKLLLRSDGTSVYITQDLGTAMQRYQEYQPSSMIYVVGNEQDYHFTVLEKTLRRLGYDWAEIIHHLSYGMVELPQGKMKSREGTVVDADDLIDEMLKTASEVTSALGKAGEMPAQEAAELYRKIGMGALKFFILKVDPKKKMLFNPEESVDFNGHTGPFIQYTHARIRSLISKASSLGLGVEIPLHEPSFILQPKERALALKLSEFPDAIDSAATSLSPALIANYVYELAQEYNAFYQEIPVIREEDVSLRAFRLRLSNLTAIVIASALELLGIEAPERM